MKKNVMLCLTLFSWAYPVFAQTDLAVGLTASTTSPTMGARLSLIATVRNLGPSNVSGVLVRYLYPAGFVLESSEVTVGTYNVSSGVWAIGSLTTGQSVSLTIHLYPTRTGRTEHRLEGVELMGTDTNPSNNRAVQVTETLPSTSTLFSQRTVLFSFYPMQNKVVVGGKSILLSPESYKVLDYLYRHQGHAFLASELISNALGGVSPTLGFDAVMRELSGNKILNKHLGYKKATGAWLFKN